MFFRYKDKGKGKIIYHVYIHNLKNIKKLLAYAYMTDYRCIKVLLMK